jgi:GH24 family phage-related lysozyme (muramidase)
VINISAMTDAVFNMGPTIACNQKKSTAARLLATGRIKEACEQLPRWDKASVAGMLVSLPGLTKRRNSEMQVCLQGVL